MGCASTSSIKNLHFPQENFDILIFSSIYTAFLSRGRNKELFLWHLTIIQENLNNLLRQLQLANSSFFQTQYGSYKF